MSGSLLAAGMPAGLSACMAIALAMPGAAARGRARRACRLSDRVAGPVSRRRLAGWGAIAFVTAVWSVGVAAAAAFGIVAALALFVLRRVRARRQEARARLAVVELLRAMAAELRAGKAAGPAFAAAAGAVVEPVRSLTRPIVAAARDGDPEHVVAVMDAAAVAARREVGGALLGLTRLAACWRVSATSGAMLAPAVDRVADALHDELDVERALATALAGPRATMRLLAGLPLFGIGLGMAIGARPIAFLTGSPAGLVCLATAGLLDGAGIAWSRRIARRAAYREAPWR